MGSSDTTTVYGRVAEWLLTGGGTLAILLCIGFIVDLSFQERLGYQLGHSRSAVDYMSLAGEFLLTSVIQSLQWILGHYVVLGIVLFVFVVIRKRYQREVECISLKVRYSILLTTLLLLFGVILVLFDSPAALITDALVIGIERGHDFDRSSLVGRRAYEIWHHDLCSRLSLPEQTAIARSLGLPCSPDRASHIEHLRSYFVLCVLGTLLTTYFAARLLIIHYDNEGFFSRATRRSVAAFAIVCGAVQISLLPYVYSKTLRPTEFNEAIVRLETSKDQISKEHGFILANTEESLSFFHKKERHIWTVPKAKVYLVKVERRGDVLQFHYKAAVASFREVVESP